jgi:hypothetical protein
LPRPKVLSRAIETAAAFGIARIDLRVETAVAAALAQLLLLHRLSEVTS